MYVYIHIYVHYTNTQTDTTQAFCIYHDHQMAIVSNFLETINYDTRPINKTTLQKNSYFYLCQPDGNP